MNQPVTMLTQDLGHRPGADDLRLTRRSLLRAGFGGVTFLLTFSTVAHRAQATTWPALPADEFRLVASSLSDVSERDLLTASQNFEAEFSALSAAWKAEYVHIFRATAGDSAAGATRTQARDRLATALSEPVTGQLAQTALNVADVLTPGQRFRNDIDDVVLTVRSVDRA